MQLYVYDHCPFSCRARMIFGLKGVPVDLQIIMEGDETTGVRLVGRKTVPILEGEGGICMAESLDIVDYVERTYLPPVLTKRTETDIVDWCDQAWPLALKLFIPRFVRADFPEIATPAARAAYLARETRAFGDLAALEAATPALLEEMHEHLERLSSLLEAKRGLSLADIRLFPILRSLSIVADLRFPQTVQTYVDTLAERSGVPLLSAQAM